MAETAFKKKITKKAFETKLIEDFGHDNLIASPYNENHMDEDGNLNVKRMTLYYINEHQHVGTWMYGEGWIFTKAYEGKV